MTTDRQRISRTRRHAAPVQWPAAAAKRIAIIEEVDIAGRRAGVRSVRGDRRGEGHVLTKERGIRRRRDRGGRAALRNRNRRGPDAATETRAHVVVRALDIK